MFTKKQGSVVIATVEIEKIELIPGDWTKRISIGAGLDSMFKEGLTKLWREYADIFAWNPRRCRGQMSQYQCIS